MRTLLWVLAAAAMPHSLSMAEGFNSCTIAQRDIGVKFGVERPLIRAYDNVCVAVLPPACRNYTVDGQPCAYRQCLVMDNVRACPNGEPTVFTSATIKPFVAKTTRILTKEDFEAMNHGIDAAAAQLAAKWTDNGRVPLPAGADKVLRNVSCQMAAFGNPDVKCVPGN